MSKTDIEKSLFFLFPELYKEINIKESLLKTNRDIKLIPSMSRERLIWNCTFCNYKWESMVSNRSIGGIGCISCKMKRAHLRKKDENLKTNSFKNKYPHIFEEINLLNSKKIKGNENINFDLISPKSTIELEWDCKKCNNNWIGNVRSRCQNKTSLGCKKCSTKSKGIKRRSCKEEDSIKNKFPLLFCEINQVDSKKIMGQEDLNFDTIHTGNRTLKLIFNCIKCNFIWEDSPSSRIKRVTGCPDCLSGIPDERFLYRNPKYDHMVKEINVEETKKIKGNENIKFDKLLIGATKIICFNCSTCNNMWNVELGKRTERMSNCPECAKTGFKGKKNSKFYFSLCINHKIFKVGITNNDPKTRTSQWKNANKDKYFEDIFYSKNILGYKVKELENEWKSAMKNINSMIKTQGHTEMFYYFQFPIFISILKKHNYWNEDSLELVHNNIKNLLELEEEIINNAF